MTNFRSTSAPVRRSCLGLIAARAATCLRHDPRAILASYLASSTSVSVPGPSPTMRTQASSSLAPSQCTCLPKCVTKLPLGMGTILSLSTLLPVATHHVPLTTVMKRSLGWKCGLLKLPGLNRLRTKRNAVIWIECRSAAHPPRPTEDGDEPVVRMEVRPAEMVALEPLVEHDVKSSLRRVAHEHRVLRAGGAWWIPFD